MKRTKDELNAQLLYWATKGSLSLVKEFIGQGADPHFRGDTVLKHACLNGKAHVVSYLLAKFKQDGTDLTMLQHYCCRSGELEVLKEVTVDSSPIRLIKLANLASKFNQTHLVDYLLERAVGDLERQEHVA